MLFEKIPKEKRELYLKEVLNYVVDRNGLASIPKSDLEACFVYYYKKVVDPSADIYSLSRIFKVKESKLKSLMELFYLKFDDSNKNQIDEDILFLDLLKNKKFEIESFEKVQIRFHFSEIEYYALIQRYFREIGGGVICRKTSEEIIVNQNRMYDVLDAIWERNLNNEKIENAQQENVKKSVQEIIGSLGNSIDNEIFSKLREKDKTKLKDVLNYGSQLAGIGAFVLPILEKFWN